MAYTLEVYCLLTLSLIRIDGESRTQGSRPLHLRCSYVIQGDHSYERKLGEVHTSGLSCCSLEVTCIVETGRTYYTLPGVYDRKGPMERSEGVGTVLAL